jgi:polar amino acid transport system substrate-binding protein
MNVLSKISEVLPPSVDLPIAAGAAGAVVLSLTAFFLLQKRYSRKIKTQSSEKRDLLQKSIDSCTDAVLILSADRKIEYANIAMQKLLKLHGHYEGSTIEESIKVYVEKEWHTLNSLIDARYRTLQEDTFSLPQTRLLMYGRNEMLANLLIDTVKEEGSASPVWGIVSIHSLEEQQKREEAEYYHRLTHLPNQLKALQDINALNARLHLSNDKKTVLMLIDIDNLSVLRSILGLEQTNGMLKKFTLYLNELSEENHFTVYHTFYNNFLLIIENVDDLESIKLLAERIQKGLSTFYKLGGSKLYLSASIGMSVYPDNGPMIKLFDYAYKALAEAEKGGHGRTEFYISEIQSQEYDELVLYNDMHEGLEREEFEVYYQPIVDAKSHKIVSAEALIRWRHPKFGMIPPDLFIAVMEKTGFIVELGRFVLSEVLKQQKRWEVFSFNQVPVSINLSLIELETGVFVQNVEQQIAYHQANPNLIRFEITEGLAMQDKKHFALQFAALKKLGIDILLDDFGSGYTSYAYLKRFPASLIKIDKVLVEHVLANLDDQAIVKSIIDLGHSLRMKIVIEGIEDARMAELLAGYGCDYFQGYHFSRPLPVFEFQKMLR